MFFIVIIGHFIAACFACMGLINCGLCIEAADRAAGNAAFFPVLAVAAWPLAVAATLETLLLILAQLEKLNWMTQADQEARMPAPIVSVKEKPQPQTEEKAEKNVYFPVREKPSDTPAPQVNPAPKAEPTAPSPAAPQTNNAPDNGLRFFKVD